MTTTAVPPWSLGDALREETDLAEIGREFSDGVQELVAESRAEARAAGRQYRLLHRLWQLQEEAREQRWAVEAHWLPAELDRLGPNSLEPEEQTLRDVADEIGPALRLPAGTALRRVEDAVLLGESLPEVLDALERGLLGARQAGVLVELWRELVWDAVGLPPALRARVEAVRRIADELLLRAPDSTVAQLRALARRRRAGLLRETEEQRHRLALRDRCVWVEPRADGMAQLSALLDAAAAHAIQDRLDALADRTDPAAPVAVPAPSAPDRPVLEQMVPGTSVPALLAPSPPERGSTVPDVRPPEGRTVPQLRADVLVDLLLDGEPADLPEQLRGIRGHVTVTVPALALLRNAVDVPAGGLDGLPDASPCAELEGYGPIPVSLAERIAARAPSWSRILTHPVTGTVLDRDRTTYAVPADLKHRLRARDGTCRFPGCRRRASRCDLDHTVAWADGGRTSADNLAHLCRHHHLVKHRDGPLGRWRVQHVAPGHPESGRGEPSCGESRRGESHPDEPRRGEPCPDEPRSGAPGPGKPGPGKPGPGVAGCTGSLDRHGVLEWTSPSGQVHRTYPQEYLFPHADADPDRAPRYGPRSCSRHVHASGPADDPPPF